MNKFKIAGLAGAVVLMAAAGVAPAQDVSAAKAAGVVGEQDDGYLGFAKTPDAAVKAATDAINIKRRQAYTQLAAQKNVTIQEVAIAKGCDQLANRVATGEPYRIGGNWSIKSGPIALPAVCG